MNFSRTLLLLAAIGLVVSSSQANWPQWRGPDANTVAPDGDYPIAFNPSENVAWKVELEGEGASTPIVWGKRVFLTQSMDGEDTLLAFDLQSGEEQWRKEFGPSREPKHRSGTPSNPSAVTDGKHVVVYFKSGVVACCDLEGKELWQVNLHDKYGEDTLWWDVGTSPVLSSAGVVIAVLQEGNSYLVTLDIESGDEVWRQPREYKTARESDQSYTTPTVNTIDGVETIVTWGADHLTGHDAKSGKQLWEVGGFNVRNEGMWRTIASATVVDGVAYVPYGRGDHLAAIRLGGSGDMTSEAHVWQHHGSAVAADVPSPVVADGKLYLLGDKGDVSCREAKTGEELWSGRLPRGRDRYFSSPLLAGGHLYCIREDGMVMVAKLNGEGFEVVAKNELDEQIVATPVPVEGSLLVRTRSTLYRFGEK